MLCSQDNAGGAKQELGNAVSNLDSLKARKWGGMLGKSSKESLFVPSGRDILGG